MQDRSGCAADFAGVGMEKRRKMEDGGSFCRGYHISKLKVALV